MKQLDFEIFETLLFDPAQGAFALLNAHVQRLEASSRELGFSFSRGTLIETLDREIQRGTRTQRSRVRAVLNRDGHIAATVTSLPIDEASARENEATILGAFDVVDSKFDLLGALERKPRSLALPLIDVSEKSTNSKDPLVFHKTTKRGLYDEEHRLFARNKGCFEVVFTNEKGELTEGSRTNLLIKIRGKWLTPPVHAGLLNGVFRQALLKRVDLPVHEETLTANELIDAERIFVMNSVRGLIEVALLNGGGLK